MVLLASLRSLIVYRIVLVLLAIPAWIVVGLVGFSMATADSSEIHDRAMALIFAVPAGIVAVGASAAFVASWLAHRVSVVAASLWGAATFLAGFFFFQLFQSARAGTTELVVCVILMAAGAVLLGFMALDVKNRPRRI